MKDGYTAWCLTSSQLGSMQTAVLHMTCRTTTRPHSTESIDSIAGARFVLPRLLSYDAHGLERTTTLETLAPTTVPSSGSFYQSSRTHCTRDLARLLSILSARQNCPLPLRLLSGSRQTIIRRTRYFAKTCDIIFQPPAVLLRVFSTTAIQTQDASFLSPMSRSLSMKTPQGLPVLRLCRWPPVRLVGIVPNPMVVPPLQTRNSSRLASQ
mmetsp:Transcript_22179/g.41566  ORF Transcript_22179/g.41566 Transcript_22179/m.41566 type:complete len:210 (-) Transcript_22179:450-1079(-)